MIVGSLTTDGNLWGSRSALNVCLVYAAQLCWNLASRFITPNWGQDVAVNVVGLFVFAGVASLMMCVQIRAHAQIWAEALQCSNVTDAKTIRSALHTADCTHCAWYWLFLNILLSIGCCTHGAELAFRLHESVSAAYSPAAVQTHSSPMATLLSVACASL